MCKVIDIYDSLAASLIDVMSSRSILNSIPVVTLLSLEWTLTKSRGPLNPLSIYHPTDKLNVLWDCSLCPTHVSAFWVSNHEPSG